MIFNFSLVENDKHPEEDENKYGEEIIIVLSHLVKNGVCDGGCKLSL